MDPMVVFPSLTATRSSYLTKGEMGNTRSFTGSVCFHMVVLLLLLNCIVEENNGKFGLCKFPLKSVVLNISNHRAEGIAH